MTLRKLLIPLCAAACLLAATSGDPLAPAFASITPERLLAHIKILASDDFAGRGPGTPGEEKTVAYLVGQAKEMGLAPGNPDGTYIQKVPLWGAGPKAHCRSAVSRSTRARTT